MPPSDHDRFAPRLPGLVVCLTFCHGRRSSSQRLGRDDKVGFWTCSVGRYRVDQADLSRRRLCWFHVQ